MDTVINRYWEKSKRNGLAQWDAKIFLVPKINEISVVSAKNDAANKGVSHFLNRRVLNNLSIGFIENSAIDYLFFLR